MELRSKLTLVFITLATAIVVTMPGAMEFRAQSGLKPVLSVGGSAAGEVPFLSAALRDPSLVARQPEDEQDATRLAHELKEYRSDLTRTPKGERAIELHGQAYETAISLSYYFETKGDAKALAATRGMALQHAEAHARMASEVVSKARAMYHMHALQFVMGQNRRAALDGIRKLEAGKGLDNVLKGKARLLIGIADIEGDGAARKKAISLLRRSQSGAEANVAAKLVLARSLAGLSKNGKKVRATDASYRNSLFNASSSAAGLSEAQKTQVLRYVVGVWRAAEGANASWEKPPFKMTVFKTQPEIKAIVERVALADWNAGRRPVAIRKYEGVAKSLAGSPLRAQVDGRILDLRRADYVHSKNPSPYQAALLKMANDYLDTGILGEGREAAAQAMQVDIARRHEALVKGEMARVSAKSAAPRERLSAIAMAERFLVTINDDLRIEDIKARMAGLYAMNGQHREAVAIYKELAETGKSGQAKKYFSLAIGSQSVLAKWPGQAPWGGMKAGFQEEREELLGLYKKLDALDQNADWFLMAHVGLLEINLGRGEAAFQMWTAALLKQPGGPHAANAAGFMMVAYQKGEAWGALEKLARLALKHNIVAMHLGNRVAVVDMLALALLEGGKDAMEEGKFAVAVVKLKEFVEKHPTAKNHDEGFYLLASAFRGDNKHQASIKTLLAFVEKYQHSKYYRPALLNGGDWSGPMAYEDNAIFFYARFLASFTKDPEAARVRPTLTALYLGRGHYSEAVHVLSMTVEAQDADAATKTAALLDVMDIEERQASVERAVKAADLLIRASDVDSEAKSRAYALKIRLAARAGRYDDVRSMGAAVEALPSGQYQQDALGEARYLFANAQTRAVLKKQFNLELTDPLLTLEGRFAAYRNARALFQNVCAAGQSSFCAPSQHQLARVSVEFLAAIEDIAIQEQLAKDVVTKFNARKQAIMNEVAASASKADDRAVAVVGEGYTDPEWTQAVLWQNSSDWTFDRVSGETGNGYVQWSTTSGAAAE